MWVLLGVLVLAVIGYFIYTAVQLWIDGLTIGI